MSLAYDEYLAEHIGNVNKGLHWMLDNLELSQEEKSAIEDTILHEHDTSKYDAEEYDAYDKYFYGGNRSYKVVQDFNYAWLHHIHKNPHHWQYWVLLEDDPESGTPYKVLEIPLPYIFEMIADWWSFSWRNEKLYEIFNWYKEHREKQIMHPGTRELVDDILQKMKTILDEAKKDSIVHGDLDEDDEAQKYGVPELKKFPMPDKRHVKSAIRFFNYIDKDHEKELADAILERMKEYGMSFKDFGVGEENRFYNYIPEDQKELIHMDHSEDEKFMTMDLIIDGDEDLEHQGTKGMHWGTRRWQYYDGRFNDAGKRRYFGTKEPGKYDKANTKKEEKKRGYDPSVKSSTNTTYKIIPGGGGGAVKDYEDWENELYKKMLESGESFDLANMTQEQFKELLKKYGISTEGNLTVMLEKAAKNYGGYASANAKANNDASDSSGGSNSIISDKFGVSQSNSKEKKGSSKSGSSDGSGSGRGSSEGSAASSKSSGGSSAGNVATLDEAEETDKYDDIMSKVYDAVTKKKSGDSKYDVNDIFSDSDDTFVKNLEELTGQNLSDLSEQEINYLRKKIKNHYEEGAWESTFRTKMDDILEKYPDAINKNSVFAKALKEYTCMDYTVMEEKDIKSMRQKFVDYYLSKKS